MKSFYHLSEEVSNRYRFERLANGLISVFDRATKSQMLFTPDGQIRSGYLPQDKFMQQELLIGLRQFTRSLERPKPQRRSPLDLSRLNPSNN